MASENSTTGSSTICREGLECSYCGSSKFYETPDKKEYKCIYCGRTRSKKIDSYDDNLLISLNRAHRFRRLLRFDAALEEFDSILKENSSCEEAAWGALLSEYGIIYPDSLENSAPTFHRISEDSIKNSRYYSFLGSEYQSKANEIESIRQNVAAKIEGMNKYDVFICYKATDKDEYGIERRTPESDWGRDIYEELRHKGYRVFFSEKVLSQENYDWEPHIFSALHSARIMLVLSSSLEHIESPWVQNEWSRFLALQKADDKLVCRVIADTLDHVAVNEGLRKTQMINHQSGHWLEETVKAVEDAIQKKDRNGKKEDQGEEEFQNQLIRIRSFHMRGKDTGLLDELESMEAQYWDRGEVLLLEARILSKDFTDNSNTKVEKCIAEAMKLFTLRKEDICRNPDYQCYLKQIEFEKQQREKEARQKAQKEAERNKREEERRRAEQEEIARKERVNRRESLRQLCVSLFGSGAIIIIIGIVALVLQIGTLRYNASLVKYEKVIFFFALFAMVINFFRKKDSEGFVKIFRTCLAIALVVVCFISIFSGRIFLKSIYVNDQYGVVYAEDKTGYSVWKILKKNETVLIQTSYNGKVVTQVNEEAAKGNDYIKHLTFESGQLTIESGAFENCARLLDVTFGDDSDYIIGKEAFTGCTNLKTVSFGNHSDCSIEKNAFKDCSALKEFDVGSSRVGYHLDNSNQTPKTIFGGETKATIRINGGILENICDCLSIVYCENNSSLLLKEGDGVKPVVNTLVFAEGFDFDDCSFECRFLTFLGMGNDKYASLGVNVYLPASITYIPDDFFGDTSVTDGIFSNQEGESTVYFAGTEEKWNNLSIGSSGNSNYTNGKVKVIFNKSFGSDTQTEKE